jgi:peptide/nickel transport system substrate-binding protein
MLTVKRLLFYILIFLIPTFLPAKEVSREKTVIVGSRGITAKEVWSPYLLGGNHQKGVSFFYEPLYFADNLNGHEYPWLAESYNYNSDATRLTYKIRQDVFWSDGNVFSAKDVAFSLKKLSELGSDVRLGGNYKTFIKNVEASSQNEVIIHFNAPSPRFHDEVIAQKGDSGFFVVPEHIWSSVDWPQYTNYNEGKGPITTSPWRLNYSDENRRILDRVLTCDDYWGCKSGFINLPEPERYIWLRMEDDSSMASAVIKNEIDQTHDLRVELIQQAIKKNELVTTWSGRDKGPYGLVSWWPSSLYVNNKDTHLSNPNVRWAISKFIDRDKVNDFAFANNGQVSRYPWPAFKGLSDISKSVDSLGINTNEYNPEEAINLLEKAGYTKKAGFWTDSSGSKITCNIVAFGIFSDIGPVIAQTLVNAGIESSYSEPPDAIDQLTSGKYNCSIFGHNGSQTGSIYTTLSMYTTGNSQNRWGYANSEYDDVVKKIAISADETEISQLTKQAMSIWLRDLPDIPLTEFFNRFAISEKYWTNWPTLTTDPYMNGLHLHTGMAYTLFKLKSRN